MILPPLGPMHRRRACSLDHASLGVVGPDIGKHASALDPAIQGDDRHAGPVGSLDGRHQCVLVARAEDQSLASQVDQGLDLANFLDVVILAVADVDLQRPVPWPSLRAHVSGPERRDG